MKYTLQCPQCENSKKFLVNVALKNDGIYQLECPIGHEFVIDILSQHFQVLFENGLQALSDGYLIESITSFSSSYERFMEYFITIIQMANKIPEEHFKKAWKEMSSRSERQLGAFVILYLQEFEEAPDLISNKMVFLRNKVIHKGYFPGKQECISYGDAVLNFIRPIIQKLKKDEKYEWCVIGSANDFGLRFFSKKTLQHLPYQIFPTNRSLDERDKKNLLQLLEDLKKQKPAAK